MEADRQWREDQGVRESVESRSWLRARSPLRNLVRASVGCGLWEPHWAVGDEAAADLIKDRPLIETRGTAPLKFARGYAQSLLPTKVQRVPTNPTLFPSPRYPSWVRTFVSCPGPGNLIDDADDYLMPPGEAAMGTSGIRRNISQNTGSDKPRPHSREGNPPC
jgi:hypothetical protein